jgi:hypothetical protein
MGQGIARLVWPLFLPREIKIEGREGLLAMTGSDALSRDGERHDDAVGRLEAALAERDRRRRQHQAAACTSLEPDVFARLCEANEGVAAREKWLEWIDRHADRKTESAQRGGRDDADAVL